MTVNTAAGAKVYIGTTRPASTTDDFAADTYTAVGEVEDLGQFGDTANEVRFTALNDRRVRKFKGSFDAGTMTVTCGADPSDTGQTAMVAAMASDFDYNFKVDLDDKLTNGGSGTILYFRGKVMKVQRNVGNVENVIRRNFDVGINTALLEIPAT